MHLSPAREAYLTVLFSPISCLPMFCPTLTEIAQKSPLGFPFPAHYSRPDISSCLHPICCLPSTCALNTLCRIGWKMNDCPSGRCASSRSGLWFRQPKGPDPIPAWCGSAACGFDRLTMTAECHGQHPGTRLFLCPPPAREHTTQEERGGSR